MTTLSTFPSAPEREPTLIPVPSAAVSFPPAIPEPARVQLMRMFRDPNLLERPERTDLIAQLQEAVALEPEVSELRVILGMALCVNYDGQTAMEELREACRLAPDSFIAQLKFGELLMRLRVCDQAAEHTQLAAELAVTHLQSELARRQAATIRTMQREGIERGGYGKVLNVFRNARGWFGRKSEEQNAVVLSTQ
ncbi:MAG TPA: hypothetical protein VMU92_12925 [Acidobacteriaceae bacterium]|nr:hypothetical protein [Acidobacteriaceae bacterium]